MREGENYYWSIGMAVAIVLAAALACYVHTGETPEAPTAERYQPYRDIGST